MIDLLSDNLGKVNDWIKFAETKNAANIAFCSAAIFAISRLLIGIDNLNQFVLWYSVYIIICLVLSLVISLLSFIPRLKVPWLYIGECNENDNLLYFGHACKYNDVAYLKALYSDELKLTDKHKIELAYSNQIVINSRIAFIKFKQFDIAIWFTVSALITPVGALFVAGMRN